MANIRAWFSRLAGCLRGRNDDRDLTDEISGHLHAHIDDNLRAGMTEDEARRCALLKLGGVDLVKEQYREQQGLPYVETTMQDFRYALRILWKAPGYTLAAIAALAIGIGANTAVFSIVHGVLLQSFPYKDPQQLVLLFEQPPNAPSKFAFSPPDFEIVHGLTRSYSGLAAYRTNEYELSGTGISQRLTGARVSPALFSVLGVLPAAGRALTEDDDRQNAQVAVVSAGLWTRTYGRDPLLLGKTISLDGRPYTVVGIMPERFEFPPRGAALNGEPADVFVPMAFLPFERQAWGMMYTNTVVARLKPGVTAEQAQAELSSLVGPLVDRYPALIRSFVAGKLKLPLMPLYEETVAGSRRLLLVLMGAVALVLFIGCADVASLILTRSASRQRELAIRAALGAAGSRIVRQLLTESFVLAAAGCTLGLALAYGLMRALLTLAGARLPRSESIVFDYRIVFFALALAIATPLMFGILPALRAARGTTGDALKESARSLTAGPRRSWLLGSLVVGQVALALVLSVGAALLVRSFARLTQTETGFRPEQAVRATVTLPVGRYETQQQVQAFYERAIDAARAIPGVVSAGAGDDLPLHVRDRRAVTGDPTARTLPDASRLIAATWTAGSYFDALGIPLERGRFFTDQDRAGSRAVVIVNQRLAHLLWPDADPIGRQIKWGIEASQSPWLTVVGVIGDAKEAGLDAPAMAQAYVPLAQDQTGQTGGPFLRRLNIVVRSNRPAMAIAADLHGAVQRLDSALPVTVQTLDDMVGDSVQPQRFSMTVMMLFAALALMLAALGIYGVLANAVAQQTQEVGVRIALGATSGDVMWMVLRRALTLMGAGLAIGTIGALAVTRAMASLLFDVPATDVSSFVGAAAVLGAVALIASLAPAWRATRVDPMVALRAE